MSDNQKPSTPVTVGLCCATVGFAYLTYASFDPRSTADIPTAVFPGMMTLLCACALYALTK